MRPHASASVPSTLLQRSASTLELDEFQVPPPPEKLDRRVLVLQWNERGAQTIREIREEAASRGGSITVEVLTERGSDLARKVVETVTVGSPVSTRRCNDYERQEKTFAF